MVLRCAQRTELLRMHAARAYFFFILGNLFSGDTGTSSSEAVPEPHILPAP